MFLEKSQKKYFYFFKKKSEKIENIFEQKFFFRIFFSCDPKNLLGIMYPQKVLHRLGDLRRGIKVLLNRFGDGFRVL